MKTLFIPRRRLLAWLLAGTVVSARSLFGQIRVCPACGTEAAALEETCRHCGVALAPPREPELRVEPEPPTRAPTPPFPTDAGRTDYQQTRRLMEEGDGWSALLWGRNAAALMALDPAVAASRAKLDADLTILRGRVVRIGRTCPACEGSGRLRIQVVSLSGQVIEKEAPGAPCPVCQGSGRLSGRMTAPERAAILSEARIRFALRQRELGREEWMGLWLPAGSWEALSIRQTAMLRGGFGVECGACAGWGRIACARCGGAARIACSNRRCAQGVEICPVCDGSGRTSGREGSRSLTQGCGSCRSSGKRNCAVCAGEGSLRCASCEGRGETVCSRCNGSGQAPSCLRCGGTGLSECAACHGAGARRGETCAACKGERRALCRACGGAGRAFR